MDSSSNNIAFSITVIDKFGRPISQFNKGIDSATIKAAQLNSTLHRVRSPFDNQSRSIAQMRENIERYRASAENSFRVEHIRRYNQLIAETEKRIKAVEHSTETCEKSTRGLFSSLKQNFGISTGMLAAGGVAGLFSMAVSKSHEAIRAASDIEKYEVALKNMLGTSTLARDRMQEYFTIAKQTPFDLPQVIEAGNSLQALGRYTKDNIILLGDLAAASGKPMEQSVRAYAKLASGQKGIAVDMFRDLMITVDDWTAATGKGVSKSGELLASTNELLDALPAILKSKGYMGMMASQAATTAGKVSNLGDSFFQLKVAIGDRLKPAYTDYIAATSRAIDRVKTMLELPIEYKIAKEKAELNGLVEALITNNKNQDIRKSLIQDIQTQYPDFIKNLNLEKASITDIRKELEKTNAEYDKKMRKAAIQRQIDKLESDMSDKMDDITEYELSMIAQKERDRVQGIINAKFGKDAPYIRDIVRDGAYIETQRDVNGGTIGESSRTFTNEQRIEAATLLAELDAQKSMITGWFVNDSVRKKRAEQRYKTYKVKREALLNMINGAPDADSASGGQATGTAVASGTGKSSIETASDVISGGGSAIKNFNITIGSMIGQNTNHFSSSDDDPDSANQFMDRLARALEMVVNDVNYTTR